MNQSPEKLAQSQDFLLDEDRKDCVYLRIDLDVIDWYSWWENKQTKQEANDELRMRAFQEKSSNTIKEPAMEIQKLTEEACREN